MLGNRRREASDPVLLHARVGFSGPLLVRPKGRPSGAWESNAAESHICAAVPNRAPHPPQLALEPGRYTGVGGGGKEVALIETRPFHPLPPGLAFAVFLCAKQRG